MMKRMLLAIAALALSACATAPSASDGPAIRDTSFTDAGGSRTIQLSTVLPAGPAEVFAAVATTEGWKTWAVPVAFGDVKTGGFMETSYDMAAKAGDPANIQQEFIAVIPEKLVVFRTTRTPPGFPSPELFYKTATILELSPEGAGTRLTLSHTGFGAGAGYDQLHGFFTQGNAQTLEQLRKRFASGPIDFGEAR
jgi:uncharacterized protein YndB with AHSA1/START domain